MTHAFDQFRAIIIIAITAALFISSSCQQEHQQLQKTQAPSLIANPEQDARTEDGYGLMAMKDYANMRFSSLGQINAQNVNQLKLAWMVPAGGTCGEEAAPQVIGDTSRLIYMR